ncbi:hypothetical protein D3C81_1558350 [compost metagenome]
MVGAVQRGFQSAGLGQLAAPLQLVAFRGFRLEVRVTEVRVIEVVEGRCAKAFAVGQQYVVVGTQWQGKGAAPGILRAELLVLVTAQAQFSGKTFALEAVLDECRAVPAAVLFVRCTAVDVVFVPIGAQQ